MLNDLKRRTIKRIAPALCLVLMAGLLPTGAAWATVQYMPDVTADMSYADYWAKKVKAPDQVLATTAQIDQLNQEIWKTSKETRDLANWPEEQYDAVACVNALLSGAKSDADYCYNMGAKYDQNGKPQDEETLYAPRIAACKDSTVNIESTATDMRNYKYAVCTTRSTLLVYPTQDQLLDDPTDPDFDLNYLSIVRVNEPLLLRTKSADGQYYAAMTSACAGWIPAEDVAICKDKQEWLAAWNYPSEQLLVVYDDKIYTEDSRFQPETANRKLPMGTCLQLASAEEIQGRISNRSAHNNHVVWMPVRKDDGTYEKKLSLIGENRKVSEGYLPMTTRNVLKVALNQLGDAYGWGGMMGTNDCSGYVRDVYRCFGIDMPRSSNRNNGVAKNWDLSGMTDEDKAAFIKRLPPGTQLAFSGHEMLYLGYEGDKLYVISSVSNVRMPGDNFNTRIRGGVINTLDILRASNTTWLHNLNYAAIPYYDASQPDPQKLANPMKVKGKSVKVSAAKLKKSKQMIPRADAIAVSQAQGTVTYKKISVNGKSDASKFTINKKTGDITAGKGVAKGRYKMKVKVTASGDANYKAKTKNAVVTIRVR